MSTSTEIAVRTDTSQLAERLRTLEAKVASLESRLERTLKALEKYFESTIGEGETK